MQRRVRKALEPDEDTIHKVPALVLWVTCLWAMLAMLTGSWVPVLALMGVW